MVISPEWNMRDPKIRFTSWGRPWSKCRLGRVGCTCPKEKSSSRCPQTQTIYPVCGSLWAEKQKLYYSSWDQSGSRVKRKTDNKWTRVTQHQRSDANFITRWPQIESWMYLSAFYRRRIYFRICGVQIIKIVDKYHFLRRSDSLPLCFTLEWTKNTP